MKARPESILNLHIKQALFDLIKIFQIFCQEDQLVFFVDLRALFTLSLPRPATIPYG